MLTPSTIKLTWQQGRMDRSENFQAGRLKTSSRERTAHFSVNQVGPSDAPQTRPRKIQARGKKKETRLRSPRAELPRGVGVFFSTRGGGRGVAVTEGGGGSRGGDEFPLSAGRRMITFPARAGSPAVHFAALSEVADASRGPHADAAIDFPRQSGEDQIKDSRRRALGARPACPR